MSLRLAVKIVFVDQRVTSLYDNITTNLNISL